MQLTVVSGDTRISEILDSIGITSRMIHNRVHLDDKIIIGVLIYTSNEQQLYKEAEISQLIKKLMNKGLST